ncbi:MAG: CoB--CoM heterodisulfide reductase iron-sulfur subunit A family protein [Candidatus Eremiobacteraeota bacterium]|nr:CoB--CoM heterodisulfide reductase iron-sulfur subunit A family protein [Candidatus Eremiobacteraeota bacterium]
MPRIGVFICHCGINIAKTVDTVKVAEAAYSFPGVVYSTDYKYMCSDPGQKLILDAIKEHNLERVVVGACSPGLHEPTFPACISKADLNPYYFEMANLREQVSWVTSDKEKATEKAIHAVRMAVAKAVHSIPLTSEFLPITKRALVIGGGISGIQAALDIAEAGFPVILVEREPSIGGKMAQLDKTFPTLDCSACILTPKMVDAARHPNITIHTYSEIESVSGFIGNFEVAIRKKARSVDMSRCTGCGLCYEKCPVKVSSEFEVGMGNRSAIYVPFPQAVPNVPVIDRTVCLKFTKDKCGVCSKICPAGAIDYEQEDEVITEKVGAIIVATGFDLFDVSRYEEFAGGSHPDIITSLQFERLINASGPTEGKLLKPSDGKIPGTMVFIQCVGSRDDKVSRPYCSRICCMYTAKQAILVREKLPDARIFVFFMDIRTAGKSYEEFCRRAIEDYDVEYIRGRVSKIYPDGDKLILEGSDTIMGMPVEIKADLVVLAAGAQARADAKDLARMLGIQTDEYDFFNEAHAKLRPVETMTGGIFLAGSCQFPRDIPDCVASASGAAAKVLGIFGKTGLSSLPTVATVNEDLCSGCRACMTVCPYQAITMEEIKDRAGKTREVARVNPGICQGCGACAAACNAGVIDLLGYTDEQIVSQVDAALL